MVIFAASGAGMATWFPYIPYVQDQLDLSNAALGLCLLGAPVGSILASQVSTLLIARLGSRSLTLLTNLGFFLVLPFLVIAPNIPVLVVLLMLLGATIGLRNVAINTQAVEIERQFGQPILSGFHAAFSLGLLASAGLAVVAIAADWPPVVHVAAVALFLGIVSVSASRLLLPIASERSLGRIPLARPNRTLLKLGTIAVCVMLAEGAMADWASVFVRSVLDASPKVGAIAYAAFVTTMAIGRLAGDRTTTWLGPVNMLRSGGAMITGGLVIAALVPSAPVAIVGFGLVGLGVSCGFPLMVSAAGRVPNFATSASLTIVTTIGSIGFLLGPPVIGLVAEATSLQTALLLVSGFGLIEIALSGEVGQKGTRTPGHEGEKAKAPI